jgi:prepilin-type N-terminal cleavage/methylation domain-containing protein
MVKEARTMICSALTPIKIHRRTSNELVTIDSSSIVHSRSSCGFTMTELVIVLVVMSAFLIMVQLNLFGALEKSKFKSQIQQLVSTMQMAAASAGLSDKRYEVIIDLDQQNFLLREITTPDLSVVLDQEIISQNNLSSNCRIVYVEFDDGQNTSNGKAKFRAGRAGWAYGGKIVVQDDKENYYSIVVNRLNRLIDLQNGDVELLEIKSRDEISF